MKTLKHLHSLLESLHFFHAVHLQHVICVNNKDRKELPFWSSLPTGSFSNTESYLTISYDLTFASLYPPPHSHRIHTHTLYNFGVIILLKFRHCPEWTFVFVWQENNFPNILRSIYHNPMTAILLLTLCLFGAFFPFSTLALHHLFHQHFLATALLFKTL
jgi:hypothetical protein